MMAVSGVHALAWQAMWLSKSARVGATYAGKVPVERNPQSLHSQNTDMSYATSATSLTQNCS